MKEKWKSVFGTVVMRDGNQYPILLVLLTSLIISCATTNIPKNWLKNPTELQTNGTGSWITVETKAGKVYGGELIAVSKDSFYVAFHTLYVIPIASVKLARLVAYNSNAMRMGILVFLGAISTLSHGFGLLATAPMWLIAGSVAVYRQYHMPIIMYPLKDWEHFTPFARYPQGFPAGIDRSKIKIKLPS